MRKILVLFLLWFTLWFIQPPATVIPTKIQQETTTFPGASESVLDDSSPDLATYTFLIDLYLDDFPSDIKPSNEKNNDHDTRNRKKRSYDSEKKDEYISNDIEKNIPKSPPYPYPPLGEDIPDPAWYQYVAAYTIVFFIILSFIVSWNFFTSILKASRRFDEIYGEDDDDDY